MSEYFYMILYFFFQFSRGKPFVIREFIEIVLFAAWNNSPLDFAAKQSAFFPWDYKVEYQAGEFNKVLLNININK